MNIIQKLEDQRNALNKATTQFNKIAKKAFRVVFETFGGKRIERFFTCKLDTLMSHLAIKQCKLIAVQY